MGTTHIVLELWVRAPVDELIGEVERSRELLVAVRQIHGGEPGQGAMRRIHGGDGEVGGELETTLPHILGKG